MKSLVLSLSLVSGLAFSAEMPIKDSSVSFMARANPGSVAIQGEGGKVTGEPKVEGGKLSGTFKVKLSDLKTGMSLRDEHFLKAVNKSEFATLILDPVEMKGTQKFKGVMELASQSSPVEGDASFSGGKADFSFKVRLSQFKLKPIDYKLLKVEDEVLVKASLSL